jgi:hypothetical protein
MPEFYIDGISVVSMTFDLKREKRTVLRLEGPLHSADIYCRLESSHRKRYE